MRIPEKRRVFKVKGRIIAMGYKELCQILDFQDNHVGCDNETDDVDNGDDDEDDNDDIYCRQNPECKSEYKQGSAG